jgi:glycosyltransferase involved in cell wall biosynthesis
VDATLTIVGTGEVETELKQMAHQAGLTERVTFTGSVAEAEKNAHLRRAHVLVHTSIREGWGLNVIEANAMGTPAIVYPVGGLVDSTLHDETGLITSTETPEAVADALISLSPQPQKYDCLRVRAWERAKSFQWDRILPTACDWLEKQARCVRRP